MQISIYVGDLCDVQAEALCTSTNPRLSLAMGTGGSVRGRGGYEILRECEAIVDAEWRRSGRTLPAGSAHQTGAGELAAKMIIHCVASDAGHRSSAGIIRDCVKNALAYRTDAGLERLTSEILQNHTSLCDPLPRITVRDGWLTLDGVVTSDVQKRCAEDVNVRWREKDE